MATRMPKQWRAVVDAVGTAENLCEQLGICHTAFHHVARDQSRLTEKQQDMLEVICNLHGVDVPVQAVRNKNLSELSMMGKEIAAGLPVAKRAIVRALSHYPVSQLTELAESDGTPEHILRAVTRLLEDA